MRALFMAPDRSSAGCLVACESGVVLLIIGGRRGWMRGWSFFCKDVCWRCFYLLSKRQIVPTGKLDEF